MSYTAAAGWYADPSEAAAHRWWNGGEWTGHVAGPGSLLDAQTVVVAYGLLDGSCSLGDGSGALIGAITFPGAAATAMTATTPRAGELEVMPSGSGYAAAPPLPPPPLGQLMPSQPVVVSDRAGNQLLSLLPVVTPGQRGGMAVVIHGPDGVEMGRYQLGSGPGQTIAIEAAGTVVATAADDGHTRGKMLTVNAASGGALATLRTENVRSAQGVSMTVSVTLTAPMTGALRSLVAAAPVAFVGMMAAARAPMPPMGPTRMGGFP